MSYESLLTRSSDSSLSQLVEMACRHWEARSQAIAAQRGATAPSPRAFTIAISREVGTLGTSVAQEVGRLLGWQVYDHELLESIAQEMGLRTTLLESVDEREQSWLRKTIGASLASLASGGEAPWASESAYVHQLVETVVALGIHGECVIVGRGAAFILPPETTLRVRLVGPVRDRIVALSRQRGISEREAARQVRAVDRQRTDFVQDHFFKDPRDPRNHDIVLNALRLSVVRCAELIVEALYRLQADGTRENSTMSSTVVTRGVTADASP